MSQESENKLHSNDRALFTGPYVPLTAELLEKIREGIEAHTARKETEFPKLVAECPYETRLAVTAWVMEHLVAHARGGGTFRWLIYNRMGFGPDAYAPLYMAGGMEISNEFDIHKPSERDCEYVQAISKAALSLEGEERATLLAAAFRMTDLAAFTATSRELLDRQRREIDELVGVNRTS